MDQLNSLDEAVKEAVRAELRAVFSPISEESISKLRLLRRSSVCERVGWSTATLSRMCNEREFPGSVSLGKNSRAWLEHEVDAWIAERVAERDALAAAGIKPTPSAQHSGIGKGRRKKSSSNHYNSGDLA